MFIELKKYLFSGKKKSSNKIRNFINTPPNLRKILHFVLLPEYFELVHFLNSEVKKPIIK